MKLPKSAGRCVSSAVRKVFDPLLAGVLGKRNHGKTETEKNRVLIWTALLIDGFEIFKIVLLCFRGESLDPILHNLPLFLCSIQLISIPMAAFAKGRVREAALDFVCIFGILGAVLGTYGAGQNYNAYPVLYPMSVVALFLVYIVSYYGVYYLVAGKKHEAVLTEKTA